MTKDSKTLILSPSEAKKKLIRISYQVYENNVAEKELILAGIAERGYILASQLCEELKSISKQKISLHKLILDKHKPKAEEISIEPDIRVKDRTVIIVDDVLNSGKTLIYSCVPFLLHGVKNIQTCVLVDRNHRNFPIAADYVGLSLATTSRERVEVEINKRGEISAYLL